MAYLSLSLPHEVGEASNPLPSINWEVTNMMTIRHLPELFEDCRISFEKVHYNGGLQIEEDICGRLDLSDCGATILTKSMIKINEEIIISFGSDKFSICIKEDEIRWNPFDTVNDFPKHNHVSDDEHCPDESGSDDDDDGVSDTWTNNHDHMYEEGEIPPDEDGRDDGAEKSMDVHESLVATPVVERSILNGDEVDGQFQSRFVGIEEIGRRDDQNNNNNFVFNAVNDNCGPIPAVNGEACDPCRQLWPYPCPRRLLSILIETSRSAITLWEMLPRRIIKS
ncbi:hypothetical protein L2E82_21437 [Cichorium intybus]|uniref:Uncharacterized protein n=1 Tax=Cichorium intybus TaxID=13427 RepID=A0ACB9DW38_CICIN|nr:hypothetical protein L2E82_21437 [Cichorium intybus]